MHACDILLSEATETFSPKSDHSMEVNCEEKYHFFKIVQDSSEKVILSNFKTIQFCSLSSKALKKSREVLHLASSLGETSVPGYNSTIFLL